MWEKIDDCMLKLLARSVPAQESYTPMLFVLTVTKAAQLMLRLVSNQSRLIVMKA